MSHHPEVSSVIVRQGLLEVTARGHLGAKAPFPGVLGPQPTPPPQKSINPPLKLQYLKRKKTDPKNGCAEKKRREMGRKRRREQREEKQNHLY